MIGLWDLFWTFAKVGVMTFGGGYAMLPILQREIIENRNWATEEELANYFAIGQCTPGIIAVNTATFIGQKQRGTIGGILATFGVVFPSIMIISVLAALITNFANIQMVQNACAGIRVCVCILIFNAICKLWKGAISGYLAFIIFLTVVLLSVFLKVSPTILVAIAAAAGIAAELLRKPPKREGGLK